METRMKAPLILRTLFMTYLGICLIHISFNKTSHIAYSDVFLLVLTACGSGLVFYAIITLIANIRVGKTRRGTMKEIKKNFDNAFKNKI